LIVVGREWKRIQQLGSDIVSAQRYVRAQVARQQAYSKVLAFGMTPKEIEALLAGTGRATALTISTGNKTLPRAV
jgi:cobalt-zinc-cadmium efflux system membrane fusion protein